MENLTNKVIKLNDGDGYFILRQAVYKGTTYFFAAQVTPDEKDFTNKFAFFERVDRDGKFIVKLVTDEKILTVLAKNIKLN